jgi:hypothetical protein
MDINRVFPAKKVIPVNELSQNEASGVFFIKTSS